MQNFTIDQYKKFLVPQRVDQVDKIINISGTTLQMDLKTDMPSDEGYKNILFVASIGDIYIDAEPLKSKTMGEVKDALERILKRRKRIRREVNFIEVDRGSEFLNSDMRAFLKTRHIQLIPQNTEIHKNAMAIIERAIGIIMKPIIEHLKAESLQHRRHANRWIEILKKVVYRYNLINMDIKRYKVKDILEETPIVKNIHKLGSIVYPIIKHPVQLLNGKKKFINFRTGDLRYDINKPGVITGYMLKSARPIRFYINNDKTISYLYHELLNPLL